MNLQLHLTDDTQLRAHGFVADTADLFAEIHWDFPLPGSRVGEGTLWGTPTAMRRLAELAIQAAIQAEEEAAWQAHTATAAAHQGAGGMNRAAGGRPRLRRPRHPRLPGPLAPPHPGRGQPGLLLPPRARL